MQMGVYKNMRGCKNPCQCTFVQYWHSSSVHSPFSVQNKLHVGIIFNALCLCHFVQVLVEQLLRITQISHEIFFQTACVAISN